MDNEEIIAYETPSEIIEYEKMYEKKRIKEELEVKKRNEEEKECI